MERPLLLLRAVTIVRGGQAFIHTQESARFSGQRKGGSSMSCLGLYLAAFLALGGEHLPQGNTAGGESPAFPWKLEAPYRYLWLRQGQKVGETRFTIRQVKEEGKPVLYSLSASRSYDREGASQRSEETTTFSADGTPLKFEETLDFSTLAKVRSHQVLTLEFVQRYAKVKYIQNGNEGEPILQTVEVPPGTFLFANQAVEHWAVFLSRLPLKFEKQKVNLFYPDFHKVLEVTLQREGGERLKVGKAELETSRVSFRSAANELQGTAWIDARGRLIQIEFPSTKAKELSLRVVLAEGE